jgi:putative effector of murein hydrolase
MALFDLVKALEAITGSTNASEFLGTELAALASPLFSSFQQFVKKTVKVNVKKTVKVICECKCFGMIRRRKARRK